MTLVIDNYDSFTFNLVHALEAMDSIVVWRNDAFDLEDVAPFDRIVLSPGPGLPEEAGLLMDVVARYAPSKRMLGVCLGFQALVQHAGGTLINLDEVQHGRSVSLDVTDDRDPLFGGIPNGTQVGLYHSWGTRSDLLPATMKPLASWGSITMAVAHTQWKVHGVQFHPESIMSEHGTHILRNWMACPV